MTNSRHYNHDRRLQSLQKLLNEFAKSYISDVNVRFSRNLSEMASGQSDLEKRIIHLSRKQKMDADAIGLGLSFAYKIGSKYRRMKLKPHEMYFLTLLHEIGHFKIKERVPKSYQRLKKEIIGIDHNHDHLVELSIIEGKIKRKAGERENAWKLRLADFMSWMVIGETISHHMKVENWAIDEFERKRRLITELLSGAGLFAK
jgi:hypothetical protein